MVDISFDDSTNPVITDQATCENSGGSKVWTKETDVSALAVATITITATHADVAGNSDTETTTVSRSNDVIITISSDQVDISPTMWRPTRYREPVVNSMEQWM